MRRVILCVSIVALVCGLSSAADISVNKSVLYQTFEGMGASITSGYQIDPWKVKVGPFYQDVDLLGSGFYDSLITELGMSMVRTDIQAGFQASPGVFTVTSGIQGLWSDISAYMINRLMFTIITSTNQACSGWHRTTRGCFLLI